MSHWQDQGKQGGGQRRAPTAGCSDALGASGAPLLPQPPARLAGLQGAAGCGPSPTSSCCCCCCWEPLSPTEGLQSGVGGGGLQGAHTGADGGDKRRGGGQLAPVPPTALPAWGRAVGTLKTAPTRSTPCTSARGEARQPHAPAPHGAPLPLSCHHLTERLTWHTTVGMHRCLSHTDSTIAILHPSRAGWGRGCQHGDAGGAAKRGHDVPLPAPAARDKLKPVKLPEYGTS